MLCRACHARLDYDDNYCRKCGAAVEVLDVQVVRSEPAGPLATFRDAALPVVKSGATLLVASAVIRFAARQLLGRASQRSLFPFGQRPLRAGEVEELLIYRRTRAD
ncbi:MAG TPA: hypothetical protein VFA70_13635 [Dehalococcoidia bacterium]|nr:hypothetical protein [Dehalococcoidia bacterium]